MVILQIESSYGLGSTGIITLDLKKRIEKEGWECYVASPLTRKDLRNDPYVYKIGNWLDHKLHAVLSRLYGKQAYFSHFPTLRLIHFIRRIKPEIIQFHDLHSNYINLNLLLKYIAKNNIKLVVTLHDCWFFTGGCFHYTNIGCDRWQHQCGECPKRMMDTKAYLGDSSSSILSDRAKYFNDVNDLTIVGVSDWIINEARKSKIKAKRFLTIHNGVDLNVFKPRESDLKKRLNVEDKFVILGPASKWFQDINRATLIYYINNLPSDTVLLLFGCTEKKEGMPNNVIQVPFTRNREELASLYSSADVMVNCSREDTLSTINLESQACGTPIVTYEATGSLETVDGECGFAVETGNYQKLFEDAMKVKDKGKMAYSNLCLSFIKANYNKAVRYDDYIGLYSQLVLND